MPPSHRGFTPGSPADGPDPSDDEFGCSMTLRTLLLTTAAFALPSPLLAQAAAPVRRYDPAHRSRCCHRDHRCGRWGRDRRPDRRSRRRRRGHHRHRPEAARVGGRRHSARKCPDFARRPRDRRDQHLRIARCGRGANRQRARARRRSGRSCCSTASAFRAFANCAICRPKRSSGWKSCPRRSRSNMAMPPTKGW